jgi:hypothetical protein
MDAAALRQRIADISKRVDAVNNASETFETLRQEQTIQRAREIPRDAFGIPASFTCRTTNPPPVARETSSEILTSSDCDVLAMGITKTYGDMVEEITRLCKYDFTGYSDYLAQDEWMTTCIKAICRKRLPSMLNIEERPWTTLAICTGASMAKFRKYKRDAAGIDFAALMKQRADRIRRNIIEKYQIPTREVCLVKERWVHRVDDKD